MDKISIHKIDNNPLNPRSGEKVDAEKVADVAAKIKAGQATIEVRRVGNSYELVSGFHRLPAMLEVSGRALVRVAGTQEQFYVRRAVDGSIVRED